MRHLGLEVLWFHFLLDPNLYPESPKGWKCNSWFGSRAGIISPLPWVGEGVAAEKRPVSGTSEKWKIFHLNHFFTLTNVISLRYASVLPKVPAFPERNYPHFAFVHEKNHATNCCQHLCLKGELMQLGCLVSQSSLSLFSCLPVAVVSFIWLINGWSWLLLGRYSRNRT